MFCEVETKLFDSGIFEIKYDKYTKEILILTSSYLYITDKQLKIISKFPTTISKLLSLENGKFIGYGKKYVFMLSISNENIVTNKSLDIYSRGIVLYENENRILVVDKRVNNNYNSVKKYDMEGFKKDLPLCEHFITTDWNMNLSIIEDKYYGYSDKDKYVIRDIHTNDIVKEILFSVSCFLSIPLKHQFLIGTDLGYVLLYETITWGHEVLLNNFDRILGLVNVPGDRVAVAESYGTISIFDMNSLKVVNKLGTYQESFFQSFVNLEDDFIISGDNEGLVTMWSIPNYVENIFKIIFKTGKIPDLHFRFK
jgi:hypothetical protein